MNRLCHLKQTLPQNIENNQSGDLCFLVLDYNSPDGLEQWVKTKMDVHIKSGKLLYYKSTQPEYFNMSHSKNCTVLLAPSRFVCNVDADNFTGSNFIDYLNNFYSNGVDQKVLSGRSTITVGSSGRVVFRKRDFLDVGGYDEEFVGWGREDYDLVHRLTKTGCMHSLIDRDYLNVIQHSDDMRMEMFPECIKTVKKARMRKENEKKSMNRQSHVANQGLNWGCLKVRKLNRDLEWEKEFEIGALINISHNPESCSVG